MTPATASPVGPAQGGVDPRARLAQVEAHLTGRGLQRVGPAVRNASMQAGGLVAYAIEAQAGSCFVAIALGSSTSTMNLFIVDPQGQPLGNSVATNNPWVRFCPQASGRHIARLQMSQGSGEYYYALYQGGPQIDPQVELALGTATTAPAATIALEPEVSPRVAALDSTLNSRNFRRVVDPFGVNLSIGQENERPLNVAQGTCYTFASFGGRGAEDTDLAVVNGQGETLVQDRGTTLDAVVEFCPPAAGQYTLRTIMYRGSGNVFVTAYVNQATATPATNTNLIAASQSGSGTVQERFAVLDGDIRARGYEGYGNQVQRTMDENASHEIPIQVENDKCYAIVAVGGGSVRNLDLVLKDSTGRILDQDDADESRAIVRLCAAETGNFSMRIHMAAGSGDVIYHAYRWPHGTRGPFGLRGLTWVRFSEVSKLLEVDGYVGDSSQTPGNGRIRREGQSARHRLTLPANYCFAVVAVGGEGVMDVGVKLSQGTTEITRDTTRDAMPNIRYCTTQAGRYDLEISAVSGSGDYFYQVFNRR